MKINNKLISIFVLSVMLLSLLCVGSFAENDKATLSEDYRTLKYAGHDYYGVPEEYDSAVILDFEYYYTDDIEFDFTDQQKRIIESAYSYTHYNENDEPCAMEIDLVFESSSYNYLSITYLRSDYYEELQTLAEKESEKVLIDVISHFTMESTEISALTSVLKSSSESTLEPYQLYSAEKMYTYTENKSGDILLETGLVYINSYDNYTFYYLDYKENGISSYDYIDKLSNKAFTVHKIEDAELIAAIDEAYNNEEYPDDYYDQFFSDLDKDAALVSIIFGTMIFGGGSIALAIIFFIKSVKAAKPFNVLYRYIGISCTVIAVLVLILFFMLTL